MASVRNLSRGASSLAVVAAMGVLAGCNQGAAPTNAATAPAPLSSLALSNAAQPIAPAPGADALPPAPPATLGSLANSGQRYAFADRAAAMNSGFGDAPPDYTFNYGGEQPWVWRGDDQSMRVAEPLADGSYRYYYYEPGAQTPYLVRDHDRSYGYDNGALVVVYDAGGDAAAPDADEADIAGRFLARARDLDAATQRAQRQAVAQANWQARQQAIDAEDAQWQSDQASNPDWRDYHQTQAQQDDAYWAAERYRREAEAARYAEQANDAQQAARDWQAAQAAQQLVTTVLQQRGAG